MKLDEEIVELTEWGAVRVPPGRWRGYEAGPEGLEILVIGAGRTSGVSRRVRSCNRRLESELAAAMKRQSVTFGAPSEDPV